MAVTHAHVSDGSWEIDEGLTYLSMEGFNKCAALQTLNNAKKHESLQPVSNNCGSTVELLGTVWSLFHGTTVTVREKLTVLLHFGIILTVSSHFFCQQAVCEAEQFGG